MKTESGSNFWVQNPKKIWVKNRTGTSPRTLNELSRFIRLTSENIAHQVERVHGKPFTQDI